MAVVDTCMCLGAWASAAIDYYPYMAIVYCFQPFLCGNQIFSTIGPLSQKNAKFGITYQFLPEAKPTSLWAVLSVCV